MIIVGVLISGSGTNLQAILDRIVAGTLDARIGIVIANRATAAGLERARAAGVPTRVLDHRAYAPREAYDAALVEALRAAQVELVVLAGFDRLVTGVLLGAFPGRVMNIHPALLPAFPGLHAQRQALEYGVRIAGATVHFVDASLAPDDTEETLARRILDVEQELYPAAIQLFAEGRLSIDGRSVRISRERPASSRLLPEW